jgi:hypothetical protein
MASSGLNFLNLTPTNGAVQELKELIFLSFVDAEGLGGLFNFMPGQQDGKKLGLIGQFGLLGSASQGCDPTYGNDLVATREKTWNIKRWEIAEQICFTDLLSTLAKTALKKKTQVADLTGTDYMDSILMPLLEEAAKRTVLRLALFGDPDASVYDKTNNSTGTLKAGTDKKYFTVTAGLWKRIFEGVAIAAGTDGHITRVTVDANTKTSIALQKAAIRTAGVATGILDDLIEDAPQNLRQAPNQIIYITQALADAVSRDIKKNNKGSELQWKSLFMGITETTYNGITVRAIPFMDEIIQSYLQNTTNTDAWDKPYRAIYTIKDNLLIGSESENEIAEIDAWFEKKDQKNYILCRDTIGALIGDENLIAVAY